ncbi:Chaperone protein dnaJ 8, chloroplastic [Sesamum angolense]|uniref:Chaperone protein dnaJ 8, chloroplastic n=1 Tax=Sesamum angolense TaxID=2727404 RepID=A0AAE1XEY3_9LAMI|nr:Chaperone protein dnaJ 8, chloroplastic [Sesamum angolense]
MAAAVGCGSALGSWAQSKGRNVRSDNSNGKRKGLRVSCVSSAALSDPYKTLRIQPGPLKLRLRRHSGSLLFRGSNCGVQFHQINEAYDIVMSNLRGESSAPQMEMYEHYDADESMRGMCDEDWDMWEEWMGWEGAGIRDYSSHINLISDLWTSLMKRSTMEQNIELGL